MDKKEAPHLDAKVCAVSQYPMLVSTSCLEPTTVEGYKIWCAKIGKKKSNNFSSFFFCRFKPGFPRVSPKFPQFPKKFMLFFVPQSFLRRLVPKRTNFPLHFEHNLLKINAFKNWISEFCVLKSFLPHSPLYLSYRFICNCNYNCNSNFNCNCFPIVPIWPIWPRKISLQLIYAGCHHKLRLFSAFSSFF